MQAGHARNAGGRCGTRRKSMVKNIKRHSRIAVLQFPQGSTERVVSGGGGERWRHFTVIVVAIPMFVGTVVGAPGFIIALLLGPETKGKVLALDLVVA